MEFFLGNVQIKTPDGLVGFYLDKPRDAVYRGFIRNYSGTAKGVAEMTFEDPEAVQILDAYAVGLTDAELEFRVTEGLKTVLNMQLDYKQYQKIRTQRKIPVMDAEGDLFALQSKRIIEIEPNVEIEIESTTLAGTQSLAIDPAKASLQENLGDTSVFITHALPVEKPSGQSLSGTLLSIDDPKKISAFYSNTTDEIKTLEVELFLKATTKCNTSATALFILEVRDSSKVVIESRTIGQLPFSNTATLQQIGANESIGVPIGGEALLYVSYPDGVNSYSITYDVAGSYVLVSDDAKASTRCACISVYDAFAALIAKMSDGKLTFKSDFLRSKSWMLTNGYSLSGDKKPIKTSFQSLFEALNAMRCLRVDVINSIVSIEAMIEVFSTTAYALENVTQVSYAMDIDRLYSQVKAGFKNWKSSTPTGNSEANTEMIFSTELKRAPQTLDLIADIITSSNTIEKVRRQQFAQQTSSTKRDTEYDDSLFLIECESGKAKIFYDSQTGAKYLNNSFSPINSVAAWSWLWGQSGDLTLSSGAGAWKSVSLTLPKPQTRTIEPEIALINCIERPENFQQIGDLVSYFDPDNGHKTALVVSATHRPFKREGENNTFIVAVTITNND